MNKIKKYIIFTIIITIIFPSYSFAKTKESCKIKDGQPSTIEEYLKSLRKISKKIISETKSNSASGLKFKNQAFAESLRLRNLFTSWNNYEVEWDYRIKEPLFNNVPKQIKRDTDVLSKEIENLDKIMSKFTKQGYLHTDLSEKEICDGVENCELIGTTGKMIMSLMSSTKDLREIMQRAGANDKNNVKLCKNILFIKPKACKGVYKTYHEAKQECQDDEPQKRINEISINFKLAKDGMKSWEDAWKLLVGGSNNSEYNRLEKELLSKELEKQGIAGGQAKQILKNLDDYNNKGGYSTTNNPVTNIAKTIANSIDPEQMNELENFTKSIAEVFKDKGEDKVPIAQLKKLTRKKQKEKLNNFNIQSLYNRQLPLAQMQDLDTNLIVGRVLMMNNSIAVSLNTLGGTIPLSEKTCNKQAQGQGKCSY